MVQKNKRTVESCTESQNKEIGVLKYHTITSNREKARISYETAIANKKGHQHVDTEGEDIFTYFCDLSVDADFMRGIR